MQDRQACLASGFGFQLNSLYMCIYSTHTHTHTHTILFQKQQVSVLVQEFFVKQVPLYLQNFRNKRLDL
jgi:hypothetical protein